MDQNKCIPLGMGKLKIKKISLISLIYRHKISMIVYREEIKGEFIQGEILNLAKNFEILYMIIKFFISKINKYKN